MQRLVVHTRLAQDELAALDGLAAERGLSRSAAARSLIVRGIDLPSLPPPSEAELLDILARLARDGSLRAVEVLLRRVQASPAPPAAVYGDDGVDPFAEVDELSAARRARRTD